MTFRVARLSLLLLVLSNCRGAVLDVAFTADASVSLTGLVIQFRGADGEQTQRSLIDGGELALPSSVRLMVDTPNVELRTLAFDTDGLTRQRVTQLAGLQAGSTQSVRVDLSEAGACPAAPPASGELVLFDEEKHEGYEPFGYTPFQFAEVSAGDEACTGDRVAQYTATGKHDGFGLAHPAGSLPMRRLSLRLWASEPSTWIIGISDNADTFWLPTPPTCRFDQTPCHVTLTPQWQRFVFDIPAGTPATTNINLQVESAPGQTLTARFDDVRVLR